MNLDALLRVFYLDLYEFDLYDLFEERITRTNRGMAVLSKALELLNFSVVLQEVLRISRGLALQPVLSLVFFKECYSFFFFDQLLLLLVVA